MFGRKRTDGHSTPDGSAAEDTHERHLDTRNRSYDRRSVAVARGGVSLGAILTGVVVAFGSLFLLSALVGGLIAATEIEEVSVSATTQEVGIGVGIGMIVAWFLACLWGGYTAGRMGRGAGLGNGILVPIVVLVVGLLVGVVVTALGADANLNLPFTTNQLPTGDATLYELSVGFGIGVLVAMLLGGAAGGGLGARWHTRLERKAIAHEDTRVEQRAERDRALRTDDEDRTRQTSERSSPSRQDQTDEERRDAARGGPASSDRTTTETPRETAPPPPPSSRS